VLLALGCVTGRSLAASRIQEADNNMVAGCSYVGEVFGTSNIEGLSDVAVQNAKTEALELAAVMRATHVVWNAIVATTPSSVSGKAYVCGPATSRHSP
jgi:hypothetical protein